MCSWQFDLTVCKCVTFECDIANQINDPINFFLYKLVKPCIQVNRWSAMSKTHEFSAVTRTH